MGKNNDPFKTGAKLSFGDFGQQKNNGWNVFVGEYGNTDTDQLWLHGKNGFYLTTYNGTHVVAYCDYNTGGSMVLKTGLMLNEMYVSCDPQLMGPTASIKTPLEKLLKLESVGFEYTYNEDFETLPGSVVVNDPCTTPKEIADSINYAKRLSRNNEGKQKYLVLYFFKILNPHPNLLVKTMSLCFIISKVCLLFITKEQTLFKTF